MIQSFQVGLTRHIYIYSGVHRQVTVLRDNSFQRVIPSSKATATAYSMFLIFPKRYRLASGRLAVFLEASDLGHRSEASQGETYLTFQRVHAKTASFCFVPYPTTYYCILSFHFVHEALKVTAEKAVLFRARLRECTFFPCLSLCDFLILTLHLRNLINIRVRPSQPLYLALRSNIDRPLDDIFQHRRVTSRYRKPFDRSWFLVV